MMNIRVMGKILFIQGNLMCIFYTLYDKLNSRRNLCVGCGGPVWKSLLGIIEGEREANGQSSKEESLAAILINIIMSFNDFSCLILLTAQLQIRKFWNFFIIGKVINIWGDNCDTLFFKFKTKSSIPLYIKKKKISYVKLIYLK